MLNRLETVTVAALTLGAFGLGAVLAPTAVAAEGDTTTSIATPAPTSSDQAAAASAAPTVTNASSPLERERSYAQGKGAAADRRGLMASLYQGAGYSYAAEKNRLCIAKRESHGNYTAGGTRSYYQGAYQLSRPLGRGVTWMMQPSVKKQFGDEGLKILSTLRKTPVAKWNRYWQDRAFFTIWRGGKGRSHWGGLCWLSPAQIKAAKVAAAKAAAAKHAHAVALAKAKAKAAAKKKAWAKAHPKAAAKAAAKAKALAKKKAHAKAAAKQKAHAQAVAKAKAKKAAAAKKKAAAAKKNQNR
jgi:hypothetical protein